jgi:hypothetical protein
MKGDARTRGSQKPTRPTIAEQIRREQAALELLCAHAGERWYAIESRFLEQFPGLSRRTASKYLSRARKHLSASLGERAGDLAAALPSEVRKVLDMAYATGNLKAATSALKLVLDLAAAQGRPAETSDQPGKIKFVIVDSPGADLVQET